MNKKIAVAGTGYVGLSMDTFLDQYNNVITVDIVSEEVKLINIHLSPIVDEEI